jgi:hypothetical protein
MSLDGYIAGSDDEMDWVFEHATDVPAAVVDEVIAERVRSARVPCGRARR